MPSTPAVSGHSTDRIPVGTVVVTAQHRLFDPRGWFDTALARRRWGVHGVVEAVHSSFYPMYEVRHNDGSRAFYERRELFAVP